MFAQTFLGTWHTIHLWYHANNAHFLLIRLNCHVTFSNSRASISMFHKQCVHALLAFKGVFAQYTSLLWTHVLQSIHHFCSIHGMAPYLTQRTQMTQWSIPCCIGSTRLCTINFTGVPSSMICMHVSCPLVCLIRHSLLANVITSHMAGATWFGWARHINSACPIMYAFSHTFLWDILAFVFPFYKPSQKCHDRNLHIISAIGLQPKVIG